MDLIRSEAGRRTQSFAPIGLLMLTLLTAGAARGQDAGPAKADAQNYETLYLNDSIQNSDAHDIVTDLRNMLPRAKVYYVQAQNAVSIMGTAEDLALAHTMLAEIGRAKKSYQLTYTITETDNGQTASTRRVTLRVASGGKAEVRQGSRVPVVTGASDAAKPSSQVQYVDVGLNINASLDGPGSGLGDELRFLTQVEESSVAGERSGLGTQDPVIRQATLNGTLTLTLGKTATLGSMDIPGDASGSGRHLVVTVTAEPAA
jgi:hypothetical protein